MNDKLTDLGLTALDELFMTDEGRKENKLPRIREIPLNEIDDMPDHPFKVRMDDEDMMELIEKTTETQEPVMRFMEYEFPNQGMEKVTDQFMLGDRYLIAPVLEQGKNSRIVHIPEGKWKRRNGEVLDGGCACEIAAKLDELIILERL